MWKNIQQSGKTIKQCAVKRSQNHLCRVIAKVFKRAIYNEKKKRRPGIKYTQILTLAFSEWSVTFILFAFWYIQH